MNLSNTRFAGAFGLLLIFTVFAFSDWTRVSEIKSNHINCLMRNGSDIFAGTADSGIYLSIDNGNHWNSASGNLPDRRISTLELSRNTIIATTSAGSFFSNNNGASWLNFRTSIPNHTDTIHNYALCDNIIIAETVGGKAYKFTYENNQTPWIQISDTFLNAGHLNTVAMCNGKIVLGVTFRIYYSTDNGMSWRISSNYTNTQGIRSIVKSGNELFGNNGSICRSFDNGLTWSDYFPGLPPTRINCDRFAVSGLIGNDSIVVLSGVLFCANGNGGLYWTSSNTDKWNQLSNNLKIGYRSVEGSMVFADMDSTLLLDTNNSTSWINISANLPRDQISGVVVSGNNIIVGTKSSGIWYKSLTDFVGVKLPQHNQECPNLDIHINVRFENKITMNLSLVRKKHISAVIFNIAGHQVGQLFEGDLGVGKHQIQCDKFKLSPGCYTVQVLADKERYIKNLTIFQ